jgi:hypothetical protein
MAAPTTEETAQRFEEIASVLTYRIASVFLIQMLTPITLLILVVVLPSSIVVGLV